MIRQAILSAFMLIILNIESVLASVNFHVTKLDKIELDLADILTTIDFSSQDLNCSATVSGGYGKYYDTNTPLDNTDSNGAVVSVMRTYNFSQVYSIVDNKGLLLSTIGANIISFQSSTYQSFGRVSANGFCTDMVPNWKIGRLYVTCRTGPGEDPASLYVVEFNLSTGQYIQKHNFVLGTYTISNIPKIILSDMDIQGVPTQVVLVYDQGPTTAVQQTQNIWAACYFVNAQTSSLDFYSIATIQGPQLAILYDLLPVEGLVVVVGKLDPATTSPILLWVCDVTEDAEQMTSQIVCDTKSYPTYFQSTKGAVGIMPNGDYVEFQVDTIEQIGFCKFLPDLTVANDSLVDPTTCLIKSQMVYYEDGSSIFNFQGNRDQTLITFTSQGSYIGYSFQYPGTGAFRNNINATNPPLMATLIDDSVILAGTNLSIYSDITPTAVVQATVIPPGTGYGFIVMCNDGQTSENEGVIFYTMKSFLDSVSILPGFSLPSISIYNNLPYYFNVDNSFIVGNDVRVVPIMPSDLTGQLSVNSFITTNIQYPSGLTMDSFNTRFVKNNSISLDKQSGTITFVSCGGLTMSSGQEQLKCTSNLKQTTISGGATGPFTLGTCVSNANDSPSTGIVCSYIYSPAQNQKGLFVIFPFGMISILQLTSATDQFTSFDCQGTTCLLLVDNIDATSLTLWRLTQDPVLGLMTQNLTSFTAQSIGVKSLCATQLASNPSISSIITILSICSNSNLMVYELSYDGGLNQTTVLSRIDAGQQYPLAPFPPVLCTSGEEIMIVYPMSQQTSDQAFVWSVKGSQGSSRDLGYGVFYPGLAEQDLSLGQVVSASCLKETGTLLVYSDSTPGAGATINLAIYFGGRIFNEDNRVFEVLRQVPTNSPLTLLGSIGGGIVLGYQGMAAGTVFSALVENRQLLVEIDGEETYRNTWAANITNGPQNYPVFSPLLQVNVADSIPVLTKTGSFDSIPPSGRINIEPLLNINAMIGQISLSNAPAGMQLSNRVLASNSAHYSQSVVSLTTTHSYPGLVLNQLTNTQLVFMRTGSMPVNMTVQLPDIEATYSNFEYTSYNANANIFLSCTVNKGQESYLGHFLINWGSTIVAQGFTYGISADKLRLVMVSGTQNQLVLSVQFTNLVSQIFLRVDGIEVYTDSTITVMEGVIDFDLLYAGTSQMLCAITTADPNQLTCLSLMAAQGSGCEQPHNYSMPYQSSLVSSSSTGGAVYVRTLGSSILELIFDGNCELDTMNTYNMLPGNNEKLGVITPGNYFFAYSFVTLNATDSQYYQTTAFYKRLSSGGAGNWHGVLHTLSQSSQAQATGIPANSQNNDTVLVMQGTSPGTDILTIYPSNLTLVVPANTNSFDNALLTVNNYNNKNLMATIAVATFYNPPKPPTPVNPSKNLTWLWILLSVLVLALIGAGAYFVINKRKNGAYGLYKDEDMKTVRAGEVGGNNLTAENPGEVRSKLGEYDP